MAALGRLVALQAQEAASPYLALWSRLTGFDAGTLDAAIATRRVVKASMMRMTLHLVTAADYATFWAAHAPVFRRQRTRWLAARGIGPARIDELIEEALVYAESPQSNQSLTSHLTEVAGELELRDWWWVLSGMTPLVHAVGHLQARAIWSFGRRPAYVAARSWISAPEVEPDAALDSLVQRYLAGFGPATVGDIAQFTALSKGPLRASIDRLRPSLRTFADSAGHELLDVPDGLLPDPDQPAPVRYLPMWDSVLLAYEDRARLIPPAYRRMVIRTNGDVLPTFLVDGQVAGLWRAVAVDGRTTIVRHPFRRLPRDVTTELDAEAEDLARFLEPREPEVYRRYRRWWERLES